MLLEILTNSGLTKKQAKVYLTCLEIGPSVVAHIAKKSKLNRATIYEVIDELVEKKLITTTVRKKRKYYIAETPEKIKTFLKERMTQFSNTLPELLAIAEKNTIKPKITYLEGLEGIKDAYRATLKANDDTLYAFVGIEQLKERSHQLFSFWKKEYIPKRKKYNKFGKLIIPDNKAGKAFKDEDEKSFRESKLLPSSFYNFECEIIVYDDITIFVSYSQNEEFALILESKPITNTVKMIWQLSWNAAYKGKRYKNSK